MNVQNPVKRICTVNLQWGSHETGDFIQQQQRQ